MKKYIIAIILSLSLLTAPLSIHTQTISPMVDKARSLYIPMGCSSPAEIYVIGSAFPVDKHLLMTAAHVYCRPEEGTPVAWIANKWVDLSKTTTFVATDIDVMLFDLQYVTFKKWATFRKPVIGEYVGGYGAAFGLKEGVGTFGVISFIGKVEGMHVALFTNQSIGGHSGSALVGSDGKVVSMVNFGWPDYYLSTQVGGGTTGDVLGKATQVVQAYLKKKHLSTSDTPQ